MSLSADDPMALSSKVSFFKVCVREENCEEDAEFKCCLSTLYSHIYVPSWKGFKFVHI